MLSEHASCLAHTEYSTTPPDRSEPSTPTIKLGLKTSKLGIRKANRHRVRRGRTIVVVLGHTSKLYEILQGLKLVWNGLCHRLSQCFGGSFYQAARFVDALSGMPSQGHCIAFEVPQPLLPTKAWTVNTHASLAKPVASHSCPFVRCHPTAPHRPSRHPEKEIGTAWLWAGNRPARRTRCSGSRTK